MEFFFLILSYFFSKYLQHAVAVDLRYSAEV